MARNITGAAFLSLDGVMQAPGGPDEDPTGGFDQGGWVFKLWDEGIEETLGALFTPPYDLLLGRRTYDIFAAYWPYADGDNKPMGEAFDAANKYVMTRGDQPLEWHLGLGQAQLLALIDEHIAAQGHQQQHGEAGDGVRVAPGGPAAGDARGVVV